MVIYNSGDSDQLINSMTSNLQSVKEVFSRLDKGSRHLDSVIDSGTLSGAAYKAGQIMFQTYIFPMIKQLNSAIDDIQNDLTSYKAADSQIKSVSNRIDEAYVKAMLANTNQLIALVEQKMRDDKDLIKSFTEKGLSGAITGLSELPGLEGQLDNLKSLKHDYEKQLEAIQTFSFSTNSLFIDSLEAFKYALQGVEIINQSKASVDGTIIFPAGADMSWSSKLQSEKFSSNLAKRKKNKKDPKIEIKTRKVAKEPNGMYPDADYLPEVVYEVYVNGVLDKEKSETLNWMMKKQALLSSLHTVGDFILVNDIYRLATGKDWLSGDKANRLEAAGWLALTALPASKLSQIAKEIKSGNKLLKGIDLTEKELKVLNDAGYFDEVALKGSDVIKNTVIKKTESAEIVNSSFPKDFQPPYKIGTQVRELELTEESKVGEFVRVYTEGETSPAGGWIMREEDIKNLTPEQIQQKFALPNKPTDKVDVILPKGAKIREGTANGAFGFEGGGTQFDLNGQRIGKFINSRPLQ